LLNTDVSIHVADAENNFDLPGATVTINGTNHTAPFETNFAPGSVLYMQAFASGYVDENKIVIVNDTSWSGTSGQLITFVLSANLVRFISMIIILIIYSPYERFKPNEDRYSLVNTSSDFILVKITKK